MAIGAYLQVAPIGTGFAFFIEHFYAAMTVAAIFGILVLPWFLLSKRRRKSAFAWLLLCLATVPASLAGTILSEKIRHQAFEQLAIRSKPLVEAVTAYTEDHHGSPPETLEALVPEYLEAIPKTGMMAYSKYHYTTGEDMRRWDDNPWMLNVYCFNGGFDRFMYYPLQNYPERGESGWYEPIADWAYYHE